MIMHHALIILTLTFIQGHTDLIMKIIVPFSSAQDGINALGKARMRSIPSLRGFPNVAFEIVSMLVWLTMSLSRPLKEDRWALPLSTPVKLRIDFKLVSLMLLLPWDCPSVFV